MDAFVRSTKTAPKPRDLLKKGAGGASAAAAAGPVGPSVAAAEEQARASPPKQQQQQQQEAPPAWPQDDDLPEEERRLRAFDLEKKWGPCIGMTRRERWQRAADLGLDPPPEVMQMLERGGPGVREACLWEGRV